MRISRGWTCFWAFPLVFNPDHIGIVFNSALSVVDFTVLLAMLKMDALKWLLPDPWEQVLCARKLLWSLLFYLQSFACLVVSCQLNGWDVLLLFWNLSFYRSWICSGSRTDSVKVTFLSFDLFPGSWVLWTHLSVSSYRWAAEATCLFRGWQWSKKWWLYKENHSHSCRVLGVQSLCHTAETAGDETKESQGKAGQEKLLVRAGHTMVSVLVCGKEKNGPRQQRTVCLTVGYPYSTFFWFC